MVSELECPPKTVELYWLAEEQKEDTNLQFLTKKHINSFIFGFLFNK